MMRKLLAAVFAVALSSAAQAAEPAKPVLAPDLGRDYAKAHDLIDIGGRRLNLFCLGDGPKTVLFEAGGSDWSDVWGLVQPAIAKGARACAYDRAGLGHSEPARLPRTPVAISDDLHALIQAAKLKTPLVLVGHSLGGFNAKLHAALYPEDVAGLVLIDPSEDRTAARVRPLLRKQFGQSVAARSELLDLTFFAMLTERYTRCVDLTRKDPLEAGTPAYRRCTDPPRPTLGPDIAAERARVQVTGAYQWAQASEILNSVYANELADKVYADLFRPAAFGGKPVIVLTHGNYDASDPIDAAGQAAGIALHSETAKLSRAGKHRVVPGTGHYIQLDAPEAVIAAISEVLDALP